MIEYVTQFIQERALTAWEATQNYALELFWALLILFFFLARSERSISASRATRSSKTN